MLPVMILATYRSSARSAVSERPNSSARLVFPIDVPSRACDLLSNVPILGRMIASSKSVYSAGFFYIFLSQYAFHVYVLIVLIKA